LLLFKDNDVEKLDLYKRRLREIEAGLQTLSPLTMSHFTPIRQFFSLCRDHLRRILTRVAVSDHIKSAILYGEDILNEWNRLYPSFFEVGACRRWNDRLRNRLTKGVDETKANKRTNRVDLAFFAHQFVLPSIITVFWLIQLFKPVSLLRDEFRMNGARANDIQTLLHRVAHNQPDMSKLTLDYSYISDSQPLIAEYVMNMYAKRQKSLNKHDRDRTETRGIFFRKNGVYEATKELLIRSKGKDGKSTLPERKRKLSVVKPGRKKKK
jgi:hypothetical protein